MNRGLGQGSGQTGPLKKLMNYTEPLRSRLIEGASPLTLDIYVSDYDIEIEDSMMISGVTSKFQFVDHKGARPDMSPSEDKVLALSIFLDKGDEWQDTIDRLSSYELIDPANGEPHSEKLESESWTEDFGLTPKRYERLTCLLYTSPSPRDATLSRMPSSA